MYFFLTIRVTKFRSVNTVENNLLPKLMLSSRTSFPKTFSKSGDQFTCSEFSQSSSFRFVDAIQLIGDYFNFNTGIAMFLCEKLTKNLSYLY